MASCSSWFLLTSSRFAQLFVTVTLVVSKESLPELFRTNVFLRPGETKLQVSISDSDQAPQSGDSKKGTGSRYFEDILR